MEELNKKIAEWCGFELIRGDYWKGYIQYSQYWQFPTGRQDNVLPNFTTSLDACFEYIVPKLLDKLWVDIQIDKDKVDVWINNGLRGSDVVAHCVDKTPALALCRAVEELIDD